MEVIKSLYDHYKNTEKKLKIICDWDEVIHSAYPYAHYLAMLEETKENKSIDFAAYFDNYWKNGKSNYGIRNPSDIYHQMPFLTIAEDLLKLIKEDKIEKLIFLSTSDDRKIEVFRETFRKFDKDFIDDKERGKIVNKISLRLLSIETQYSTKAKWIKENTPDLDVFIDDNPNICKSVLEFAKTRMPILCSSCLNYIRNDNCIPAVCDKCPAREITVIAPYYPAIANQHDEKVLLVKNEVSDLKIADFN